LLWVRYPEACFGLGLLEGRPPCRPRRHGPHGGGPSNASGLAPKIFTCAQQSCAAADPRRICERRGQGCEISVAIVRRYALLPEDADTLEDRVGRRLVGQRGRRGGQFRHADRHRRRRRFVTSYVTNRRVLASSRPRPQAKVSISAAQLRCRIGRQPTRDSPGCRAGTAPSVPAREPSLFISAVAASEHTRSGIGLHRCGGKSAVHRGALSRIT